MNHQLVNLDVTLCFEIKNSELFGGEGSIGYASTVYRSLRLPDELFDKIFDESDIQKQVARVAKELRINPENVKLITKEEYDRETADDECEAPQ